MVSRSNYFLERAERCGTFMAFGSFKFSRSSDSPTKAGEPPLWGWFRQRKPQGSNKRQGYGQAGNL
jgi:hypothetical protein